MKKPSFWAENCGTVVTQAENYGNVGERAGMPEKGEGT